MLEKLLIRDETAEDIEIISEVTQKAFETLEISDHTEKFVIEGLRTAGVLTLSLVAEVESEVVGHIAFSPISISDGSAGWYGLGPVSVLPQYQRKGIGKALIRTGLSRLKSMGAKGCCLVGHPEYYPQFGFMNTNALHYEGVPPEAFFALCFSGEFPRGEVVFHPAFGAEH